MPAALHIADDLYRRELQRAESIGNAAAQGLLITAPITFAIIKINGQQP